MTNYKKGVAKNDVFRRIFGFLASAIRTIRENHIGPPCSVFHSTNILWDHTSQFNFDLFSSTFISSLIFHQCQLPFKSGYIMHDNYKLKIIISPRLHAFSFVFI